MTTLIGVICLLLLFILIGRKSKKPVFVERLARISFNVAMAIVLLFVINIIVNKVGVVVPVNVFMIVTIALLGFPGWVCIALLITFNNF